MAYDLGEPGATRRGPLVPRRDRRPEETDEQWQAHLRAMARYEGVEVECQVVGEGAVLRWSMRTQGARLRGAKALAELRDGTTADTAPTLWADGVLTPDAYAELVEIWMDIATEANAKIYGVTEGGRPALVNGDARPRAQKMERAGLLDAVVNRVMELQAPEDVDFLSSES